MDRTKLHGIHSKHYQLSFTISSLSSHDYLGGYSHALQNDLCLNYFFHAMDRTKHHLQILVFFVNLPLTVCVKLLPLLPRFPFLTFTFLNVMEKEDTKWGFHYFPHSKEVNWNVFCTFVKPMFIKPTWGSSSPQGFEFFFAFHLPHKCCASLNFLWSFMISYER